MSGIGIPISDMREIIDIGDIGGGDVGNVININDIGSDDFRMGLLANTNVNLTRDSPVGNTISINAPPPLDGDINIAPLEPLDMNSFEIPIGTGDILGGGGDIGTIPNITINKESTSLFENSQSGGAGYGGGFMSTHSVNPEEERKEKADLINKLNRLEAKGFPVSRKFTMENSLEDIKTEFNRLVDARQLENSIKFQRQMMMGMVTGLEMLNEKFNPLDWKLDGWSESVHENVEDFDEVFEELYDKYKGKGNMPPEARLLFMLAGSGFMFHMSNSFFRAKAPTMDDIMAQNPALRAQFAQAAAQAAGPGFGNFMGMAMGGGGGGGGQPQMQMPPQQQAPGGPGGMFFQSPMAPPTQMPMATMPQSAAAADAPRVVRKEMRGPAGVDDILKTFQEVRQAEVNFGATMSGGGGPGGPGGFGMPLDGIPSFNSGASQGFNAPAMMAAAEMQSIASDDIGSVGTSATGNTRGGSRKRKGVPIGNTVTLNV